MKKAFQFVAKFFVAVSAMATMLYYFVRRGGFPGETD